MSSPKPKKRLNLKIQVSFEFSRMSDDCLASAYEQVIPIRKKTIRKDTYHSDQATESINGSFEEMNTLDSLDSLDFG